MQHRFIFARSNRNLECNRVLRRDSRMASLRAEIHYGHRYGRGLRHENLCDFRFAVRHELGQNLNFEPELRVCLEFSDTNADELQIRMSAMKMMHLQQSLIGC